MLFIFIAIIFLMGFGVHAFVIQNSFSSATFDGNYSNRSVLSGLQMWATGGELIFNGTSGGACQYPQSTYLTSSNNYLGVADTGEFSINVKQISGFADGNVHLTTGVYNGQSAGVALQLEPGDYFLVHWPSGLRLCAGDNRVADGSYHQFKVIVTRDGADTVFHVYWDGILWCTDTQSSLVTNLYFNISDNSCGGAHQFAYDTLYWTNNASNVSSVGLDTGVYCLDNEDCTSGYCLYHKCALKTGSMACTANAECMSGECTNGHCIKEDIGTAATAMKNDLVGSTTAASILFCLFFILAPAVMIIWKTGSKEGVIAAIGWMAFMTIGFTMLGWIPAFLIIGLIILAAAMLAFGIILTSGG